MLTLTLLTAVVSAAPEFTFVECETTDKHIAVQSKRDHYLVHFHIRMKNCMGQTVFARVRSQLERSGGSLQSIPSTTFVASTENDLWSVYLRVPRYSDLTLQGATTYQIELGIIDSSKLNEYRVFGSFGWRIERQDVSGSIVEKVVHKDGRDVAIMIPIPRRSASIEGGGIRIYTEVAVHAALPVSLKYGVTDSLSDTLVDGGRATKKIN